MSRFDGTWENVDILLTSPSSRTDIAEQIFAEYMRQTPDFAALWGYAVISFPPRNFTKDLEEIAISHASTTQIEALRKLVKSSFAGSKNAQGYLREFDPESKLTPSSSDADYARVLLDYRGPHPVHGYLLYEKEIGEPLSDAETYYNGPQVGQWVKKYCPNTDATNAKQ
jgi:hypothetical protein